ncbi:hypothetical protein ACFVYP_19945 [Kitasatospora sp. NPDC058201]|uniref:hypothetical protein n=1 Tax=unclassified Kitasatospora TaxID=2633591 RepID=UPI00365504A3
MIVIIGLVILVAAVVVGVAGVLTNTGSGHALTGGFEVFGYHVTGSTVAHRNRSHPFGHRSDPGGPETPPRADR